MPEQPRFDIREYRVEGNTLLPTQLIERLLYPSLGKAKTIDDVESARSRLEQAYHDAGYPTVLVNIPEQRVTAGVVRLQAVEGRVDRLRISGSRYFSLDRIRSRVPSLSEGAIPNLADAQRDLAALNRETADRSVMPVMRAGRVPGTVEVELKVKDQLPLHGSIELDDRYGINTSRLRLNGTLRYDNLWQLGHSLSLQYQTAPKEPSELQVWVGTYVVRRRTSNNVLAVYGVHSDSDTAAVGTLGVIGKGDMVGLREIIPLEGDERYTHSVTLGVDFKDFSESIRLQGADTLNTPINYVPWSIQYNGTRHGEDVLTQFGGSANFGIRGLGNDPEEFDNKRFNAHADYLYLRGDFEREQGIFRNLRLRVKVAAQVADSPLISNEQFSAGGFDSVRGYHESERLGDNAVQGTLELSRPLPARGQVRELAALAFLDGAALRLRDALPGQDESYELSSAGLGLRLRAWQDLSAALDWARVFKETDEVDAGDQRVHFSVEYSF
jgi:hemolysin activation/secretion protein